MRGNREEAKIANAYARKMNVRLREVGIYTHPTVGWIAASPDRLVVGSAEVIEIKSTSAAPSLSDSWLIQLTIQLACVGVETGYLVAQQVGRRELVVWKVKFDRELFSALITLLAPLHVAAMTAIKDGTEDETEMPLVPRAGLQELKGILREARLLYVSRVG